jgi:peptidoglycan-associated lipoprotein
MRKLLIKTQVLLLVGVLAAGCSGYHLRKGDEYYDNLAYSNAIKHYEKLYEKNKDCRVEHNLADSYLRTGRITDAEQIYARVVTRKEPAASDYLNYGKVLMSVAKHQEAIPWIEKYLAFNDKDVVAKMMLAACKSVNERYRDTTLFELNPVETGDFANSFSVVEYREGIVFTADKEVFPPGKRAQWTGNSYLNLYYMEKDAQGNWLPAQALQGDITGPFHDGPATFSKDGNTVYFTRSNYFRRQLKTNDQNVSNLKIFKARLVDGKWKNLEEFPYNSDDYSVGHPTLSHDGKTLYFVSDMPGGLGGTDMYKSTFVDGKWSKPENLGSTVNTRGNEMFPYIHEDGSLYFSSDAHNSMGGLDVFISYESKNGQWAAPENLNYPVNSVRDDFSFSINKETATGFVTSSRADSDKIYSVKKNAPTFQLFGFARKKGTQIPVEGVTVEITDSETYEVIKMVSGKDGKFQMKLGSEKMYLLLCTKIGCFTRTDNISTKGLKYSENFYADFEVEDIVIDKPIVLENIYYDFDKWNIRPDAALELDKFVKLLKDNPQIVVELGSHTDSRGADNYNLVLSDRRAMSAVYYLIKQGIDPFRLSWKGYGETQLVNKCANGVPCSEEEHQQNRRTEFRVKKILD